MARVPVPLRFLVLVPVFFLGPGLGLVLVLVAVLALVAVLVSLLFLSPPSSSLGFRRRLGSLFLRHLLLRVRRLSVRPFAAFPLSSCGVLCLLGSLCTCDCVVCVGSGLPRSFLSLPRRLRFSACTSFASVASCTSSCGAASSFSSTPGRLASSLVSRCSLSSSCVCCAVRLRPRPASRCRAVSSVARPWRRAGWGATFFVHRHSGALDESALGCKPVRLEFPGDSLAYTGRGSDPLGLVFKWVRGPEIGDRNTGAQQCLESEPVVGL